MKPAIGRINSKTTRDQGRFNNPVPMLSDNNVAFICREISDGYDYFIEYGMGCSTLYFLEKFKDRILTIVSVENTINWFRSVVEQVKTVFDMRTLRYSITSFTITGIYSFAKKLDVENTAVPPELSRRKKWKENILLGPFSRFLPYSGSRFSGKIPAMLFFRFPMKVLAFFIYALFPDTRPLRGEFAGTMGPLSVILRNVPPAIKDQYGESPSRNEYIDAGLRELQAALEKEDRAIKAGFVIDGGPRGEIVRKILQMEERYKNFYPAIFLCDAHQAYYGDVIRQRPSGIFLQGSNVALNGQTVQLQPKGRTKEVMLYLYGSEMVTKEELAKREVWFYRREPHGNS